MSGTLYSVIYIATLSIAFIAVLVAIYHFMGVLRGIRKERKALANFLAPLIMVIPGMLTKEGDRHRIRFVISLIVFFLAFFSIYLMVEKYGKPPYMKANSSDLTSQLRAP